MMKRFNIVIIFFTGLEIFHKNGIKPVALIILLGTIASQLTFAQLNDTIWYENFDNLADGVIMNAGKAGWNQDLQGTSVSGHFQVNNNKYEALHVNSEVLWVSEHIDIRYYQNVGVQVDLASAGVLESTDSVNVYYRVDDGPPIPLQNAKHNGNFSPVTATASGIYGTQLQIIAHFRNDAEGEIYTMDNVYVTASSFELPDSLVWYETFNELNDGKSIDYETTAWSLDRSNAVIAVGLGYCEVQQKRLLAGYLDGEVVWNSEVVSIAAQQSVDISADIYSYGSLESTDYIRVYYRLNGGPETLFDSGEINGISDGLVRAYKNSLSGSSIQIVVRMFNTDDDERHMLDNILIKSNGKKTEHVIWYEDFDNLADGVTMNAGQAGWDRDLQGTSIPGSFQVEGHKLVAHYLNGEVLWVSEYINIKYFQNVSISVDLASEGALESTDSVNVYYRLDGGLPIPLRDAKQNGNFSPVTATASGISGEKLQIIAHFRNNADGEKFTMDNIFVTGGSIVMPGNLAWYETFNDLPDYVTSDQGSSAWISDTYRARLPNTIGFLEVRQLRFLALRLYGEALWFSDTIDISPYPSVDISADIYSYGPMESNDYIKVYYKLNDGPETLLDNGEIIGTGDDLVTAYKNEISGNTIQIITRFFNSYSNERHSLDNILVKYNVTDLLVEATGGIINCVNPKININVTSNTSGVSYIWSGPDGFVSGIQNPEVSTPGDYIATVTYGSQIQTDTAKVTLDLGEPDVSATGGTITCTNTSVTLKGNSLTSGITYEWTGPENYSSTEQNPVTSKHGEYILSVMNPLNGCASTDTAMVQQDTTAPEDITATVQDTLTCTQTSVTLTGTSGTSGVIYNWSGPNGFSFTGQNPEVSNKGIYYLLVSDPVNGCSSSTSVMAEQDTIHPSDVMAIVSGVLTCTDTTVTLTGSSSSGGVTYSWLDSNELTLAGNPITVSIPGTYILTVTKTANGCVKTVNVTVEQNIEAPADLTASVSDTLRCTVPLVLLSASSTTDGVTYFWEGPFGFTSDKQNDETGFPGNYTVTATDPGNNCTSVEQITVFEGECLEP